MPEEAKKGSNYFQLFELAPAFRVDKALVRKKYLELSRRYHPDYFANASEEAQQQALQMTADLNKAVKVFNNEDDTIRYLLQQKGLLEDEEKYALPPQFLMEMMELNEAADEARTTEAKQAIQTKIAEVENEIYAPVQSIVERYQEGVSSEKELLQVKDYYFKKKYLRRLRQQLDQKP
jgi:molecular chaperone HscB